MKVFISLGNSGKVRLFLPLLVLVIFSLFLLSSDAPPDVIRVPSQNEPSANEVVVTVSMDNAFGTRSFRGDIFAGMTVADALSIAGRTGEFHVAFTEDGMPATVDGEDGPWRIEQNGQPVGTSLFAVAVSPGDRIMVRPLGAE